MSQADSTMAWTIWAFIYRFCTITFSILVFFEFYLPGCNSLLDWALETEVFVVKVALIASTICHALISVYPLHFVCSYIHNGHLHRLLQDLVSTNYVDPKYIDNELFESIL